MHSKKAICSILWRIVKSFFQIYGYVLFGKRPDVIFCYPQNFNRSEDGTNPYMDTLMTTCQEANISYRVFELTEVGIPQPQNKDAVKLDFMYWHYVVLSKVMTMLFPAMKKQRRCKLIYRFIDALTFRKFHVHRCVTIAGMMAEFFIVIHPQGIVYDLQHGIIYQGHPGYFEDDHVAKVFRPANSRIMVWGSLYRDSFKQYLSANEWNAKIHVVGYPLVSGHPQNENGIKSKILISLQLTSDADREVLKEMLRQIEEAIESLKGSGLEVLLKHHPRFNGAIDLSGLYEKYPFAKETRATLQELAPNTFLHLTLNSTTCFEYANYKVPTYFIKDEILGTGRKIFKEMYKYPLYWDMSLEEVMKRIAVIDNYKQDCAMVKAWYDNAYAPYNKEEVVRLLKS